MAGRYKAADAKVRINGLAVACQRFRRHSSVRPIDASTTEGTTGSGVGDLAPDSRAHMPDLREGEFEFEIPIAMDDNDPYAAPLQIQDGGYYGIRFYPRGLAGPVADYGLCLCVETYDEGTVGQGGTRQVCRFVTDGGFALPGQA